MITGDDNEAFPLQGAELISLFTEQIAAVPACELPQLDPLFCNGARAERT